MSRNFTNIKTWYTRGIWSIERVKEAVKRGLITAAEFEAITGTAYQD